MSKPSKSAETGSASKASKSKDSKKPPKGSNPSERVIALALLLTNTRRGLTREEIRSQIGEYPDQTSTAFEKMFERDKLDLRAMGLELITESDDFDEAGVSRYRVDGDRSYLAQAEFTADEADAIVAAAAIWGHAQWFGPAREALAKLPTIGSAQSDAVGGALAHEIHPLVDSAMESIGERQAVRFDYLKPNAVAAEERTVDPWAVVQKNGNWYLVGHDHLRQAVRSFRLSRIEGSLKDVGKPGSYEVPEDLVAEDLVASEPLGEPTDVTLRLQPGKAWRLRESLGIPESETESTVPITGLETLIAEVLSFGAAVQVLAPSSVRSTVEAALAAVLDWQTSTTPPADPAPSKRPRKRPESSETRVRRILTLVPWVSSRGGVVLLEDAAEHFGVSVEQLRSDVQLLNCTEFGEYHRTVEVDTDRSSIIVLNAMGLDRPMQLTGQQAAILLAGLRVLSTLSVPLNKGAIDSATEKLLTMVGSKARTAEALRIATDSGNAAVAAAVTQALQENRRLRFRYQNSNRDQITERLVDPIRVHLSRAHQYLTAWCTTAQDERTFRLDRMLDAQVSEEPAQAHDDAMSSATSSQSSTAIDPAAIDGEEVTVELAPSATWWCEYVPHTGRVDLEGGGALVTLPVSQRTWLIGSLLTLRGGGRVISPPDLANEAATFAADALAQYRS